MLPGVDLRQHHGAVSYMMCLVPICSSFASFREQKVKLAHTSVQQADANLFIAFEHQGERRQTLLDLAVKGTPNCCHQQPA